MKWSTQPAEVSTQDAVLDRFGQEAADLISSLISRSPKESRFVALASAFGSEDN